MTSHVTVTGSDVLGTAGPCDTSRMTGAMSLAATELGAPGVPPSPRLASQFWPDAFEKAPLTSSIDRPRPSAIETQLHPVCPSSVNCRHRMVPVAGPPGATPRSNEIVAGDAAVTVKTPLYSGWSAPKISTVALTEWSPGSS